MSDRVRADSVLVGGRRTAGRRYGLLDGKRRIVDLSKICCLGLRMPDTQVCLYDSRRLCMDLLRSCMCCLYVERGGVMLHVFQFTLSI